MLAEITINVPVPVIMILENLALVFITGLIVRKLYRRSVIDTTKEASIGGEDAAGDGSQMTRAIRRIYKELYVTVPCSWYDIFEKMEKGRSTGVPSRIFHILIKEKTRERGGQMAPVRDEHRLWRRNA